MEESVAGRYNVISVIVVLVPGDMTSITMYGCTALYVENYTIGVQLGVQSSTAAKIAVEGNRSCAGVLPTSHRQIPAKRYGIVLLLPSACGVIK